MTVTDAASAPSAPGATPDPKRWLALGVIAIAQLMVVLDASIVTIALPSAQKALHISTGDRQWVLTAYTLAFGGLLLLGGRIADFVGRKRIFVIGLVGFALSSALGGAAQSAGMLFGARALQGAFGALMAPAALSIVSVTFTEARERAKAFAVYGAIAGAGAAIGLIAGGILTEYASWRWCLLVNIPVALLTAVAAVPVVRESRASGRTKYDLPGTVVVTAGLVALVYGFTTATTKGWGASTTLAYLLVGAFLVAAFVVIELRSSTPLLPMRVILDRNRGGSFIASFLAGAGLFGMFLFLSYYFQGTLHYSALKSGFAFLPFSGGVIVAAGLASRLLPKLGPRVMMVGGFIGGAVGLIWLTTVGVSTSFVGHVLPAELLMSVGLGLAFVPMSSTALIGVAPRDAGVASATLNATQQVGGSLGTALLNTIAATATASYVTAHGFSRSVQAQAQVHGFTTGFWVSASLMGVAALVSFGLIRASRESLGQLEGAVAV